MVVAEAEDATEDATEAEVGVVAVAETVVGDKVIVQAAGQIHRTVE